MRGINGLLLALSLALTAPAQILLNECETGIDAAEIFNHQLVPADIGGWRAEWGGFSTNSTWYSGSFTFPAGTVLPPGGVCVLRESTSTPVPPGTMTFQTANIYWVTAGPGVTAGGSLTLVNALNLGVDTVRWYGAYPPGGSYGAFFTGILSPTSASFGRGGNQDTDHASDWVSGASSLGTINAGQSPPALTGIAVNLATNGLGSLQWSVATANPPVPGGEIFNFVSLLDHEPDGSGPFFGIGLDALPQIARPADPSGIFHTFLDGGGNWSLAIPAGIPAGLHVEFVSVLIGANALERISPVAAVTF
jgi:hypothetical protein